MRNNLLFILLLSFFGIANSQQSDYSIEYEMHKVGVFNPQWEVEHVLNPTKFEHITGFFREELAKTVINGVKQRKVKIYDSRKRELTLDSVINNIVTFEKQQGVLLDKRNALDYIIPYISAYDFEEAVTYDFRNLSIEKQVISYCPYVVHYRKFNGESNDSVQLPLFWIFPKDTLKDDPKLPIDRTAIHIPDTVLSVLTLKYPVKMPFTSAIFDQVRNKKIQVFHSDGSEFVSPKEIDDLFVIKGTASVYNEETGEEKFVTTYSDIVAEDLSAIRIAENWAIKPYNLQILKTVKYFLPLYPYDEQTYTQLGVRIWVNKE